MDASLLTHKPQAKPCHRSRRVASIIKRIDLGYASNPMRVLISLTAATTAERMIFGKVLNYLKAFCVVIQKNYGATKGTSSLSDNTAELVLRYGREFGHSALVV